jgi:hypothetical protein
MATWSRTLGTLLLAAALSLASGAATGSEVRAPSSAGAGELWYDSSSLGWGIRLTTRGARTVATLYVCADAGGVSWYATLMDREANSVVWTGDLYAMPGPWLGAAPDDLASLGLRKAGTMRWQRGASDSASDILLYSVDGRQVTENIARRSGTVVDDCSGRYAAALSSLSCAGAREDVVELSITQGDPALTFDWASPATGVACRCTGIPTRRPVLGDVEATHACGTETGAAHFYSMIQSAEQLTVRWQTTRDGGGCATDGHLTAVRRR